MNNIYIREMKLNIPADNNEYPYCLPVIRETKSIKFNKNVTFFVGENGTGKSTLVEALAMSLGLNAEGGSKNFIFETKKTHSELYENITLVRGYKYPRTAYFFRAESFYNLATNIDDLDEDTGIMHDIYGGKSLHEKSHGEAFLSLFTNRFYGNGIYILDEPEAALSPMRQLSFLRIIDDLCKQGAQFIIATHSPIILSYPEAQIYSTNEGNIDVVHYEETEHYMLTKNFLNDYKLYLHQLLSDD